MFKDENFKENLKIYFFPQKVVDPVVLYSL